jgi:patatin-like phospholipase/acyl hydrolase
MAAPTFFAPIDGMYWDGGMAANNPAIQTLAAMRELGSAPGDERLLDLVTSGKNSPGKKNDGTGFIVSTLTDVVLPALTSGNASSDAFVCAQMMPPGSFMQVAPVTPDWELSEVSKASICQTLWEIEYDAIDSTLTKFLKGI